MQFSLVVCPQVTRTVHSKQTDMRLSSVLPTEQQNNTLHRFMMSAVIFTERHFVAWKSIFNNCVSIIFYSCLTNGTSCRSYVMSVEMEGWFCKMERKSLRKYILSNLEVMSLHLPVCNQENRNISVNICICILDT